MQPLLDAPPPVHPYAPGSWGPEAADELVAGPRQLARALGDAMSDDRPEAAGQSAAAPSPFPPIADYAFLSNCHTGALVAAGRRRRLALRPVLRLAERLRQPARPRGRRVPARALRHQPSRRRVAYEPGTNVLVTTWKTPTGWIVVRDALTIGPRDHEDEITPHTRPPADDDADHMLVRTGRVPRRARVEVELVCEPVFDYGRVAAEWTIVDGGRHAADASGAGVTIRLQSDMASGSRATASAHGTRSKPGERAFCVALLGRGPRLARRRRGGRAARSTPRSVSGAPGSGGPASRTTAGATRSSGRRSRSRA